MHIFHKWTKWGEPYKQGKISLYPVAGIAYTETHQKRKCTFCGKTEVRAITS